ncbi:MAG: ATP-binding protein [Ruminococcus flavefaciens]|nr:ATP-binding protein [Ruminococcus flavefaciens]
MKSEIFEKVQIIIQNRRRNAVIENERRIDEINERIPQIREINNTIANAGKELIKIIRAGDNDKQQRIEKLKRDNLDAQKASRWCLVQNGYPADYLDIHYTCPVCSDTGYDKDNNICECFIKLCGKLEADEINKHSHLELSSFDTFSLSYYMNNDYYIMKEIYESMKRYAEKFNQQSKSLLLLGGTGLGKTHLSLAIANKVLEKGYSVVYDSTINILHEIEKEHFSREHISEMTDLVMQTDLLILDDLGTEHTTPFYSSTIYNIINTRLNRSKPTIISTNLEPNEISKRYEARVASRLVTQYINFHFVGSDVRLQKYREKM